METTEQQFIEAATSHQNPKAQRDLLSFMEQLKSSLAIEKQMRGKWFVEAGKLQQRLDARTPQGWNPMDDERLEELDLMFSNRPADEPQFATALAHAALELVKELRALRGHYNELADMAELQHQEFETYKKSYQRMIDSGGENNDPIPPNPLPGAKKKDA